LGRRGGKLLRGKEKEVEKIGDRVLRYWRFIGTQGGQAVGATEAACACRDVASINTSCKRNRFEVRSWAQMNIATQTPFKRLNPGLQEAVVEAYRALPPATFPARCPFTAEQILDPGFLP
jgi:hypothetical protein